MIKILTRRPLVVALAGPNGAGKSSFYRIYLRPSGLHFVNVDVLSWELRVDAYQAAELADRLRRQLIDQRESFIFETVFSDPVGDKLSFLKQAESIGYTVVLFFIGINSPQVSDGRVAIGVSKGGHDVPAAKIVERFPRVMHNLQRALKEISNVRVYDNSDLTRPYRLVATREDAHHLNLYKPIPVWLRPLLP